MLSEGIAGSNSIGKDAAWCHDTSGLSNNGYYACVKLGFGFNHRGADLKQCSFTAEQNCLLYLLCYNVELYNVGEAHNTMCKPLLNIATVAEWLSSVLTHGDVGSTPTSGTMLLQLTPLSNTRLRGLGGLDWIGGGVVAAYHFTFCL